jgi:hypothetical protein
MHFSVQRRGIQHRLGVKGKLPGGGVIIRRCQGRVIFMQTKGTKSAGGGEAKCRDVEPSTHRVRDFAHIVIPMGWSIQESFMEGNKMLGAGVQGLQI